jgi:hypothetical protein
MKEEDLIQRLKSTRLPDVELPSHRSRLKMALLRRGYLQGKQEVADMEVARTEARPGGFLRGLAERRGLRWGMVAGVAAAIVLVIMVQIFRPLGEQSSTALASDIVMADPAVLAALESGQVEMVTVTEIVGDRATVLVEGAAGDSLSVEVNLSARAVTDITTVVFTGPKLNDEEEALALSIARADPRVAAILEGGAEITMVLPVFVTGQRIDPDTGKVTEEHSVIAQVWMTKGSRQWYAYVDLDTERVTDVVES